jgi:hypothetical protein
VRDIPVCYPGFIIYSTGCNWYYLFNFNVERNAFKFKFYNTSGVLCWSLALFSCPSVRASWLDSVRVLFDCFSLYLSACNVHKCLCQILQFFPLRWTILFFKFNCVHVYTPLFFCIKLLCYIFLPYLSELFNILLYRPSRLCCTL